MNKALHPIRWTVAVVSSAAAILALAGTVKPAEVSLAADGAVTPASAQSADAALAARLTPRQLAGQRVIYSYSGLTPPASLLQRIRAGQAGGVIFFGGNISSESQIHSVVLELEKAAQQSPVKLPLLLMTDQEGGEVRRLPGAPTLSEKQIGEASNGVTLARQAGRGAGLNLRGVGMNVNLAPVLDVFRTPGDFDDQYQRSYSSNPATAAALGHAFIAAQQRTGVAATAKHFPGLGAATAAQNTDLTPVTLHVPLARLRSIDERPYPAAISAGVKLVMASWAIYPALDAKYPAGLSSRIIQGELRGRLHFSGVTITDAIEAGALKNFGGYGARGVLAARAGMDLLLGSGQNATEGDTIANALTAAYQKGSLNRAAFLASVDRVLALRRSL